MRGRDVLSSGLAAVLALGAVVAGGPTAAASPTVAGVGVAVAAPPRCPADRPLTTVSVSTVPVVPGARIVVAGQPVVTDGAGRGTVQVCRLTSAKEITGPTDPVQLPGKRRAVFDRTFLSGRGRVVQAAFGIDDEVSFSFLGLPTKRIESFTLRSSTGEVVERDSLGPVYLPGTRVLRGPDGLEERKIYYSVDSVLVAGSSVVNRSQVKFYPADRPVVRVPLLAYEVRVEVVDRLFRWPTGSRVTLAQEGQPGVSKPLENGVATFKEVPRGDYKVVAQAPGLRIDRSVILSRDQVVVMPVLTWVDLAVLIGVPLLIALGLVLAPRPRLRQRLVRMVRHPRGRHVTVAGEAPET